MSSLIIFSRREVLRKWRKEHSRNATFMNLAKCFYDANRLDMVDIICEVVQCDCLGKKPLKNYHEEKQLDSSGPQPGTVQFALLV